MSTTDSDDDMDWEEVMPVLPINPTVTPSIEASSSVAPIQITIQAPKPKRSDAEARKEKNEAESLRRFTRLQAHRVHTVALFTNSAIRNRWINDPLLHARLISLTPLPLQTSFSMITKKNQPDQQLRGRQFEAALTRLAEWWSDVFEVDHDLGVRHKAYDEVTAELSAKKKGKGKARDSDSDEEDDMPDRIRSPNSLMKHALMMRGSRDTSAQLFTALCRSLAVPARLVVSLQPVLWRKDKTPSDKKIDRAKQKARKQQKEDREAAAEAAMVASVAHDASGSRGSKRESDDDVNKMDNVSSEGQILHRKGKGKELNAFPGAGQTLGGDLGGDSGSKPMKTSKPAVRLRKTRPQGRKLNEPSELDQKLKSPPVFWTEVFSRPDGRWLPVDPINAHVDKKRKFEPGPSDKFNHMMYVVAFEEDGYVRDVTPRYAKNYGTKILKERRTGIGQRDWWGGVLPFFSRPYRLQRDDVEDEEFENFQNLEGMPSSIGGFKNHPLYALERHLKREEVIYPKTEIGKFRGEPVYSRSNVLPLKTSENWIRVGRTVKEGYQPLKTVKVRAVTIQRKRAVEMAIAEAGESGEAEGVTQGLYAEWQTTPYVPEPVVDGKVPKNDFGNIDLYVPSMLPPGAVHIPYKGTAKIARQLGIDYAEAVTGFEFRQRRAFPLLTGIVIPEERESEFLEVYWKTAQANEEKERQKKQDRVIKHWTRLIQGLRIKQRLNNQYSKQGTNASTDVEEERPAAHEPDEAGGFLHELDWNIAPFTLPKNLHVTLNPVVGLGGDTTKSGTAGEEEVERAEYLRADYRERSSDEDDMEEVTLTSSVSKVAARNEAESAPQTMAALAEANRTQANSSDDDRGVSLTAEADSPPKPTAMRRSTKTNGKASARIKKSAANQAAASISRRSRKRRRPDDSPESTNDGSNFDGDDDDKDADEGEDEGYKGSSRSVQTRSRGGQTSRPAVPKSDRILRSRAK